MAFADEPNYESMWQTWKASPPSPAANAQVLRQMDPLISRAAETHVGQVNPIVKGRARAMALQSLHTYDPAKGRLQSHVYNHLQGLKRYSAQVGQGVHVPERVALDRRAVTLAEQELRDRLGRDPTDDELADHSGLSARRITHVRSFSPGVATGRFAEMGEGGEGFDPAVRGPSSRPAWEQMVVADLDPRDQLIVRYHRQGLENREIARRLRVTPGLVSQRKAKIQQTLDREAELSPF